MDEDKLKELLFPHTEVREVQDELINEVEGTIKNKKSLIMHAPTGLGKTASTLPIALSYAIKNKLTVFFLTSRHTQHKIAVDTLIDIKKKYKLDFVVSDIIGKKWMCGQAGIDKLYSSEFYDYCKALREEDKCEFYTNTKASNKLTVKAKKVLKDLEVLNPVHSDRLIEIALKEKLCPYEVSIAMSNKAKVIVCDYNYIFNSHIQNSFFSKAGIKLEDVIVIVDEGHNLPSRMRDLMTNKLTSFILDRSIKEAKKFEYNETLFILEKIKGILKELA
ncbi:DEAD/DEAH box helicase family protein, partial [Nanoarchaeota archaeon]